MSGGRLPCCSGAKPMAPPPKLPAAVDKRIEHQPQKLRHDLEGATLRAGCRFAVDLGQAARLNAKNAAAMPPVVLKKFVSALATFC